MTIGGAVMILYWTVFILRRGFEVKVSRKAKSNAYDISNGVGKERKMAEWLYYPLQGAKGLLMIAKWLEIALLIALLAWLVFFIGAIMTGGIVIFGKPV